jgi:hypothetical protein
VTITLDRRVIYHVTLLDIGLGLCVQPSLDYGIALSL